MKNPTKHYLLSGREPNRVLGASNVGEMLWASTMKKESTVESPCIRNCCLDDKDTCLGCKRTLTEILNWNNYSEQEQKEVLLKCKKRRDQNPS